MNATKHEDSEFKTQLWLNDLKRVVRSAKTREEEIALKCFEKALSPLLHHPESLRTLLGKIAMSAS
jgi:hypothetical protein